MERDLIPGLLDDVAIYCLVRVSYISLNVVASVCRRWRQLVHSSDFFSRRHLAGVAISLFALYLRYNPIIKLPLQPTATIQSKLDVEPDSGFIVLFDPTWSEWRRLPPIPTIAQHSCVEYQIFTARHRIVVVGYMSALDIVPLVHIYDLHTRRWRTGEPCPSPKSTLLNAIASDGIRRVFTAGGLTDQWRALRCAYSYDVDEDRWEQLPDIAEDRILTTQGYFHDGIFYVVGGKRGLPGYIAHKSAALFHTSTGKWSSEPDFLRYNRGKGGIVFAPDGNRYELFVDGSKLIKKEGDSWCFVCNLPSNVDATKYYSCLFAWKGGFVLCGPGKRDMPNQMIHVLELHQAQADGEVSTALSCRDVAVPSQFEPASLLYGCCLEI